LLRTGERIPSRLLDVKRLGTPHGHPRVAVLVPKHGFTAVRRNRLKRRLRELARLHLLTRPCSCDVMLRARRETYEASFTNLWEAVEQIALRLA
jgi:ribonuclease P protein component